MKIYKFKFQLNYSLFLLSFLICFTGSKAYSQKKNSKETGEIVMTADELESLLTKIAERRKEVLNNNKVLEIPMYQQPRSVIYQSPSGNQDLSMLNYKLDLLLSKSNIAPANGSNTTYILPSQTQGKVSQPVVPNTNNNLAPPPPTINRNIGNMSEGGREVLKSHQVFFANNSTMISSNDKRMIQELIPMIKENQNGILVVLKGFASKLGNAFYNNELSYNRADAIKQILVTNGVSPSNIIIFYHGEDGTTNDKEARRVEVSLELIDQK